MTLFYPHYSERTRQASTSVRVWTKGLTSHRQGQHEYLCGVNEPVLIKSNMFLTEHIIESSRPAKSPLQQKHLRRKRYDIPPVMAVRNRGHPSNRGLTSYSYIIILQKASLGRGGSRNRAIMLAVFFGTLTIRCVCWNPDQTTWGKAGQKLVAFPLQKRDNLAWRL